MVANQAFVGQQRSLDRIHIYIGGDGRAWLNRSTVSADPTARSLALELMSLDDTPALYLGRPCYHGRASEPPCEPILWTHARWGTAVLDSMAAALNALIRQHGPRLVSVYGYSGGGVLAILLARKIQAIDQVITIAAPLDTAAWSAHHGYTPLSESLNPAAYEQWPRRLEQWHWQGGRDAVVPPETTDRFRLSVPDARFVKVAQADHSCCWLDQWPVVLDATLHSNQ